jgi:hypothetical protein
MLLTNSAYASNIVEISVGSESIPFLLDDKGQVWTFHSSKLTPSIKPYKLESLKHIKKIAPYIAIDDKGEVYTWHLNPVQTSWDIDDGSVLDAVYTIPTKVENLNGVTLVASSSDRYFVAVINNNLIVDWSASPDNTKLDTFKNSDIKTITSRQGVIDISATWKPKSVLIDKKFLPSSDSGVVALFKNGDVIGWGIKPTGVVSIKEAGNERLLTQSPGAISVAMNSMHTVVLTLNGVPQFCGGCDGYHGGLDFKGQPWTPANTLGVAGSVEDVSVMSLFSGYDNVRPNVFIKRDGTVWAAYAPAPTGMLGKDCYLIAREKNQYWQIQAGNEPASQVAATGSAIYMLDGAHKLWMTKHSSMNMKFVNLPINLEQ